MLEASIARFRAACFTLECAPPLGAMIVVDQPAPLYAVVSDIRTEGRDPGRRPSPHGDPGDDRARVMERNPQIQKLLQTTFDALVVGFREGGTVLQYLPEAPAPIFGRVRLCDDPDVRALSASFDFLRLLLDGGPLADEVTAACLRRAADAFADRRAFLVLAGKTLTRELSAEPERLAAVLRRIRP